MKWITQSPEQALGHILCHNIADTQGHKALHKGTVIGQPEIAQLRALGVAEVTVAVLDPGDVHEDEAAHRLTYACVGEGVSISDAGGGRVNLLARQAGIVKVNRETLQQINEIDGLTIATVRHDRLVTANTMVATIKILPYAVSEADLVRAERIGRAGSIMSVRALRRMQVGIILTGSEAARERIVKAFAAPLRERVAELGSEARDISYVAHAPKAIASAIELMRVAGAGLIIIAGETSIMDREDITPRGIVLAGGVVEHYGAPVEPGNLLLLAYIGGLPVIGAPGCVRSRDENVVDLILPRLLSGERLARADIVNLADGGLLI
ncbi:MAG: molybdopterin-binding protein [Chloroflexi bacterium]|nr:molybdopterin-binding protein [Chloroflexota bacterium]